MEKKISDDVFKCIFVNDKIHIWITIPVNIVPEGPVHDKLSLVEVMAWRQTGAKPLPEPMMTMVSDVTRPQQANPYPGLCVTKASVR